MGADERMYHYLGSSLSDLIHIDEQLNHLESGYTNSVQIHSRFNPQDFVYADFKSIIEINTANRKGKVEYTRIIEMPDGSGRQIYADPISVPILTQNLRAVLRDPQNLERLNYETDLISTARINQGSEFEREEERYQQFQPRMYSDLMNR